MVSRAVGRPRMELGPRKINCQGRALMVPDCRGQESSVGISLDSIRLHPKWPTKAKKDFKYLDLGQVYFGLHMSLRNIYLRIGPCVSIHLEVIHETDRHLHPEGQAIRRAH